ncbi:PREDICTED: berberine bridge enzyme-like 4 [Tarenaya hassleriana]|uniref:berberine bridge enzyme-like 4 n=1 Tax=Tarenaya hassleriana TaxID=28532 RepID=UPI00053C4CEF|nr:PREDICTED: berberine bridge enzyme-like 4 [Tarenaya hassleriana]
MAFDTMKGFIPGFVVCLLVLASDASAVKHDVEGFLGCLPRQASPSSPISGAVYTPKNSSFDSVFVSYTKNKRFLNPRFTKPVAIVTAQHVSHVPATVVCAKHHGLQIRVRSGGHDYEGLSYTSSVPFVILDMFNLRYIDVDLYSETAWVQAGATMGELYTKIADASKLRAFPAGVCPTLGAGGHISGGGYGNLIRKYGISVDHVVDALLVDVNGRVLNRTNMGEDLFWAIRGSGGASFGVILAWKIKLVTVPETVTVFRVNKTLEQGATDVLYKWQLVASKLPEELFLRAMPEVSRGRDGNRTIVVLFIAQFLGPAENLLAIVNKNLPELGLKRQDCIEMSWLNSTVFWADFPAGTPTTVLLDRPTSPGISFKSKSDYVKRPIPKEGMEKMWKSMLKFNSLWMQWNPYGGVMDRIPETSTPFPHRKGNLFKIQYFAIWTDNNSTDTNLNLMNELYKVAEPYVSSNPREAFLNYRDIDVGSNPSNQTNVEEAKVYGTKYFRGNLKRLMAVKTKYDPSNFFKNEQSIPPTFIPN